MNDLSTTISQIVAQALDQKNFDGLAAKLNSIIPANMSRADRAAELEHAYVYALVCEQPGYNPDGSPGYLASDTDLKAAVLNEISAMIEADFDKSEHRQTWEDIKKSVEATPEKDFIPGVAVNCPDDYLLTLDRISCAEALTRHGALPLWVQAAPNAK